MNTPLIFQPWVASGRIVFHPLCSASFQPKTPDPTSWLLADCFKSGYGSKDRYQKWNPGTRKHRPKPAYPWLFNLPLPPRARNLPREVSPVSLVAAFHPRGHPVLGLLQQLLGLRLTRTSAAISRGRETSEPFWGILS